MRKQLVPGQIFAGKFRLERQIGSGGMGVVWHASNLQLEIPVAIKVMNPALVQEAESVARFEREAKAAARIRGRHVVNIYEHGVHEGLCYMAMELLEGEDLNERLKREGRLSLEATVRVVGDLCKALQRAHELGVVHRDLKPANIFLTRDGDEEIAKVLDFGIAKLMYNTDSSFVSATGQILGTPTYMSPEQIRATKHVDARADLWSLAVIAFRALTGAFPFSGSLFDVTSSILGGPTPVASAIARDLAPEIDAFFARAMARDIDRRFQSARELSGAFSVLSGHAILISGAEMPLFEPPNEDVTLSDKTTQRLNVAEIRPLPAAPAADQGRPLGAVPLSDATTQRSDDEKNNPPPAAPAADQELPIGAVPLSDATTQRSHGEKNSPPPVAPAADQEVAVDDFNLPERTTQRRYDNESRPAPAASAADQELAARRPVHENLADPTVQRAAERAGRSWVAWVVILSAILVIVAALLAVAFSTRPDHGSGRLLPRDSTPR